MPLMVSKDGRQSDPELHGLLNQNKEIELPKDLPELTMTPKSSNIAAVNAKIHPLSSMLLRTVQFLERDDGKLVF